MARAIMTAATSPSVPIPTICSNSQTKRKISARKKNTKKNDLRLLLAICSYMDDLRLRLLRRYAPRKDQKFWGHDTEFRNSGHVPKFSSPSPQSSPLKGEEGIQCLRNSL